MSGLESSPPVQSLNRFNISDKQQYFLKTLQHCYAIIGREYNNPWDIEMSNEAPSIINTLYLKCHAWHSGGWEGRTTHGKVT